ncbi:MAG: phospholipid carrier-dependent glycosyltransferase [Chloroflexi bacterium]|nr:phospholipid carrier-dependent glycosyltransferase [Chloroflexota bacterium]
MSLRLSRSPALLLLLVLLLAAFLRFWQLSDLPPGLYHDEAYNGLDALALLQGKTFPQFYEGWELYAQDAHASSPAQPTRFPIFFEGNYGREPLHIYLMALSIWLFGPTPFAIRFVPALFGVLAVFTTYLAADAIVNRQSSIANRQSSIRNPKSEIPLLAAFFMAVLFPAIHFSRFGLRMMPFVVVETLAVYFFWRGVNGAEERGSGGEQENRQSSILNRQWFPFVLAGLFLGLGVYVYAVGRMLPLLFALFVPLWFWRDRAARRLWPQVAVMAAVSLLTALPLLLYFARYPYFFSFRMSYVANKGKGVVEGRPYLTWLYNIGRVFRGLFWQGETHLRHNLPGRPYLDPIQAILFLVGLVHLLRQKFNPRAIFLLIWLIVMLLPTILSGDAPHFGRMSGAAPVIAILIAIGLEKLIQLSPHSQFTIHNSQFILLFLLASLFFTVRDYFFRYANHPQLAADFHLPDWELGQYAAAQPADAALYFTPTQEEMATIYFALADPERLRSYAGGQGLVPMGEEGQTAVYLLRPTAQQALAELQAIFPTGYIAAQYPNFIAFHLPAAAPRLPVAEISSISFADTITLRGWQAAPADEALNVTLVWQAQAPIGQNYTAFVHLVNEAGELVAQLDRPPAGYPTADWRVGEMVLDTYRLPLPLDLPPGQYTIQTGFYSWPELVGLGETAVVLGQFNR